MFDLKFIYCYYSNVDVIYLSLSKGGFMNATGATGNAQGAAPIPGAAAQATQNLNGFKLSTDGHSATKQITSKDRQTFNMTVSLVGVKPEGREEALKKFTDKVCEKYADVGVMMKVGVEGAKKARNDSGDVSTLQSVRFALNSKGEVSGYTKGYDNRGELEVVDLDKHRASSLANKKTKDKIDHATKKTELFKQLNDEMTKTPLAGTHQQDLQKPATQPQATPAGGQPAPATPSPLLPGGPQQPNLPNVTTSPLPTGTPLQPQPGVNFTAKPTPLPAAQLKAADPNKPATHAKTMDQAKPTGAQPLADDKTTAAQDAANLKLKADQLNKESDEALAKGQKIADELTAAKKKLSDLEQKPTQNITLGANDL